MKILYGLGYGEIAPWERDEEEVVIPDNLCDLCRHHVEGSDSRFVNSDEHWTCCTHPDAEEPMLYEWDGLIMHNSNVAIHPEHCRLFAPRDDFRGVELCELCRDSCGRRMRRILFAGGRQCEHFDYINADI